MPPAQHGSTVPPSSLWSCPNPFAQQAPASCLPPALSSTETVQCHAGLGVGSVRERGDRACNLSQYHGNGSYQLLGGCGPRFPRYSTNSLPLSSKDKCRAQTPCHKRPTGNGKIRLHRLCFENYMECLIEL